MTTTARKPYLW